MNIIKNATRLFSPLMQSRSYFRILLLIFVLCSCAPRSEISGPPFSVDLLPPELQQAETLDERNLRFVFNEPIQVPSSPVTIQPQLPVASVTTEGKSLIVLLGKDQKIGTSYTVRITVTDQKNNSLSFLYRFSGWNPRIPGILINEINPKGSGKTPDCIELYAVKGGNLGGLCLRIGTGSHYSGELIFPSVEIKDGDYILIHAKAEGIPEEIDELENIDISGGLLALDTVRDFWIPKAPGLPGNNGALTLFNRKGGEVIDAVLWSNRADNREDDKSGWTSDGFIFASELGKIKAWNSDTGNIPYPSEAVDVSLSTATRSLCRSSTSADTNKATDWHTVPTRGHTFGTINSDDMYSP